MDKKMLLIILVSIGLMVSCSIPSAKEQEPLSIYVGVTYVEKSLDNLIDEAELIVIGEVDTILPSRWSTFSGKRPNDDEVSDYTIYTDVIFQVNQVLKGQIESSAIHIRTFGGKVGQDQMVVSLETQFEIGQTYLLFLSLDTGSTANIDPGHYSEDGGGGQGVYEIHDGKAISGNDEWILEDMIAYIQNALQNSQ